MNFSFFSNPVWYDSSVLIKIFSINLFNFNRAGSFNTDLPFSKYDHMTLPFQFFIYSNALQNMAVFMQLFFETRFSFWISSSFSQTFLFNSIYSRKTRWRAFPRSPVHANMSTSRSSIAFSCMSWLSWLYLLHLTFLICLPCLDLYSWHGFLDLSSLSWLSWLD